MRYFLNQNYNYGAVAVDYLIVDKHENILKRMNAKINEIACGIMYRRECIYEIGLFNDGFKMREGHELNKRFRKKFRIAHLELPLYKYRHYDGNRTKNIKKLNEYDNKLKKNKLYFISEIGMNYNGNIDLCYELIKQSKLSGADFVKFQLGWRDKPNEINALDDKKLKS